MQISVSACTKMALNTKCTHQHVTRANSKIYDFQLKNLLIRRVPMFSEHCRCEPSEFTQPASMSLEVDRVRLFPFGVHSGESILPLSLDQAPRARPPERRSVSLQHSRCRHPYCWGTMPTGLHLNWMYQQVCGSPSIGDLLASLRPVLIKIN